MECICLAEVEVTQIQIMGSRFLANGESSAIDGSDFGVGPHKVFESLEVKLKNGLKICLKAILLVAKMYV